MRRVLVAAALVLPLDGFAQPALEGLRELAEPGVARERAPEVGPATETAANRPGRAHPRFEEFLRAFDAPRWVAGAELAAWPPLQGMSREEIRARTTMFTPFEDSLRARDGSRFLAAYALQRADEFIAYELRQPRRTLGVSWFDGSATGVWGEAGGDGPGSTMSLSTRVSDRLEEGFHRFQLAPWSRWSSQERRRFIEANHVLLHECSHRAGPRPTPGSEGSALYDYDFDYDFEETLAEFVTYLRLPRFFERAYGIALEGEDLAGWSIASRFSPSGPPKQYSLWVTRLQRVLAKAAPTRGLMEDLVTELADGCPDEERPWRIARRIARAHGATPTQAALVRLARAVVGAIIEPSGMPALEREIEALRPQRLRIAEPKGGASDI
ncbi:MAG: hypothetical protein HY554_06525 [Elusimicrobia bacterium]|nr:hypothetical protein [Elusimicrobiota bacterium]